MAKKATRFYIEEIPNRIIKKELKRLGLSEELFEQIIAINQTKQALPGYSQIPIISLIPKTNF